MRIKYTFIDGTCTNLCTSIYVHVCVCVRFCDLLLVLFVVFVSGCVLFCLATVAQK